MKFAWALSVLWILRHETKKSRLITARPCSISTCDDTTGSITGIWSTVPPPYVIGSFLYERPRKVLYDLAKSANPWKRRTAIVSTYYFMRHGQVDDAFLIAEKLVHDSYELVQKAVGSWVREAGKQNPARLRPLLEKYAASMPRPTLRLAVEKTNKDEKQHFMNVPESKE